MKSDYLLIKVASIASILVTSVTILANKFSADHQFKLIVKCLLYKLLMVLPYAATARNIQAVFS